MKIKSRLKNKFIPVNIPKIFNQEKINVKKCLDTGWISSEGEYVKKFEKAFSKYNKRIYGIAVSSGTGALEIAMKSLNLKRGDEVITSGGIVGKVERILGSDKVDLLISENVTVQVVQSTIQGLLSKPDEKK